MGFATSDTRAETKPEVCVDGRGKVRDRIDATIHAEPARSPVEGWKVVGLQAEDGDAQRL